MSRQPFHLFCVLLLSLFWILPCQAASAAGADEQITPDQAQRAVNVLQDDPQRAEAIRVLKAIAATAPGEPIDADRPPAETFEPAAEVPAPADDTALAPLQENGLTARTLDQIGLWLDGLGSQLGEARRSFTALPAQLQENLSTPPGRERLWQMALSLALVFAIGLLLEWGLSRLLRRSRQALVAHADAAERRAQAREAARSRPHASSPAQPVSQASPHTRTEGLRTESNQALVQTHRDGVDRVETIEIAPTGTTSGGPADQPPVDVKPRMSDRRPSAPVPSQQHREPLRHLPFVCAMLLLKLLPLTLFFGAAGLTLHWTAGSQDRVHDMTGGFIAAYVATRLVMILIRLVISPVGRRLQLLQVQPDTASVVIRWARCTVVLATFGIALANATDLLGGGPGGRLAITKLVSLLVHLLIVLLILKMRHVVSRALAAPENAEGTLASLRNGLAQVWAASAIVLVSGAWVIWALGVQDGFPKLIYFLVVSLGILLLARLAAMVALGALEEAFQSKPANDEQPDRAQWLMRYYPLLRALVLIVIAAVTLVALFQAWGLHAIGWFAPGTIGRSLSSAALTILIAAVVASIIWQAVNLAVERQLNRWEQQGERLRAVRLRTLQPMLRTCLFIVMLLVVCLTALSEIGINIAPLLAGASIIGVAIGFGSQKLVQDFITGIFLLLENAMQVGDWVTVAGVSGTVEYLSIRTVRLRAGDGSLHIVPFSSVSTVNNTNRGIGNASVSINVTFDTDIERATETLKQIGADLREDPAFKDLILNDIEVWGVDAVDGSMVTLVGRMQCIDKGRWGVQREINRRILERFRTLGIRIANPRVSLLLPPDAGTGASVNR